jgi:hypothetical protein|tara:strand:+ start:294 stop:500 length:207 start_codon:yes stop_codon:yes gene_type:complete
MKTPNWEEHTEKLLNYYEMSMKSLTITRDEESKGNAREIRKQIIAIGKLLDEAEKNLYDMAQELHPPV